RRPLAQRELDGAAPGANIAAMEIPRDYNAATWFVDRHVAESRAARLAVIHEGGRLTYGDVAAGANRLGNALRRLGVQREQQFVVAGRTSAGELSYDELVRAESAELAPAETTKDDVAFWLYTSGTTGTPKAAVHLHHDMLVCCEAFGRHVLEIGPDDRTFSVAKLFFAYGLGNALYFPFHVGATTVLLSGRPEPAKVFEVINRERPTLFFAVPTAYAAMLQLPDAGRSLNLGSVRLCISAGEPLPKAIYQ